MYDELVKKIRHCATDPMHCLSCGEDKDGRCFNRLMTQAADAIEELTKRVMLAPIDSYAGLKRKYIVLKADTGEDVPDCFVLRPAKDHAAVEALRAYAMATDNKTLADDIYRWVGPLPTPPKEEAT